MRERLRGPVSDAVPEDDVRYTHFPSLRGNLGGSATTPTEGTGSPMPDRHGLRHFVRRLAVCRTQALVARERGFEDLWVLV